MVALEIEFCKKKKWSETPLLTLPLPIDEFQEATISLTNYIKFRLLTTITFFYGSFGISFVINSKNKKTYCKDSSSFHFFSLLSWENLVENSFLFAKIFLVSFYTHSYSFISFILTQLYISLTSILKKT